MKFWKKNITAYTLEELITKCKENDRQAQYQLYERFSPNILGVCKRYVKGQEIAEEMLSNTFIRVFNNIHQFSGVGSFDGWIRTIAIRECIAHLRAQRNWYFSVDHFHDDIEPSTLPFDQLEVEEIIALIDTLPNGYREVFNLYVIEGMKHQEIASLLNISENTSKTQLMKAKNVLKTKINELYTIDPSYD
ncbi:MAG: sigma-70 family RNA polymerase sigma factor [Saprospiraceae bacterium]|nr:sigma-70 family RNA polymerase sigma factor [Saprospiraceae bacterium]